MFNNANGYSLSDIAAATGGNRNDGFGFGGENGSWLFLLFIIFLIGGWGGNGYGGWGNNGGEGAIAAQATADVQRGFDQSAVMTALTGINNNVTAGFSGAEISRCNSQANILQTLNNNQTGVLQGLNTVAMSLQQCLNNFAIGTCVA